MSRLYAPLIALAVILLVPSTAQAYSAHQGDIFNNAGEEIHLYGVNWFGFETQNYTVHGLWSRGYKDMIAQIKDTGFTAVRLPFCPTTLQNVLPNSIQYPLNQDLEGLRSLDVMDKIIEEFDRQGLYILLDHHRPNCSNITELWHIEDYSEDQWINDLVFLADRYRDVEHFIGLDLKNEPHGQATWGTGDGRTDWKMAAERAAASILRINPKLLIFVEGIGGDGRWWGGNLENAHARPLDIPDNKLVLSPHVYGPDVYDQAYFSSPEFPANMPTIWDDHWGYLTEIPNTNNTLAIGEFGGRYGLEPGRGDPRDKVLQDKLIDYLVEKGIDNFFYWSWNPNSGDTGGILKDDWRSVWQPKVDLLHRLMYLEQGPDVPNSHQSSSGIWLSRDEIMTLPMSGAGWDNVKAAADSTPPSPNLSNQDQDTNVIVLAKALVYVRTGDQGYKNEVVDLLMQAIDTEVGGRTLALARELPAYVIAADLVDLEQDTTKDARFRAWLSRTLTENLSGKTLISTHEDRPNNWGTHAGAARAAVAAYLGDQNELNRTAQVFKGWLGDRSSYAGFDYGDLSWQCNASSPVGINPMSCMKDGRLIDGAIPDDMRRGGSFAWPPRETGYAWEAMQGVIAQAEILHRAGYDAWNWENQAILRAAQFLERIGWEATGDDEWQTWLLNHRYGTGFSAANNAGAGKNMGWTDWTHATQGDTTPPNPPMEENPPVQEDPTPDPTDDIPVNFKVAFIGDSGAKNGGRDHNFGSVLRLIQTEGADMVIHQGDLDYIDNPQAWESVVNEILGNDFPYFASVGNHDQGYWSEYQTLFRERMNRIPGAECQGDYGVNSLCTYKGLPFVLSGIGTLPGQKDNSSQISYIRNKLGSSLSPWKVCSWHKNQKTMNIGHKGDETGWDAYEACREVGAIIATGHSHTYSRTKTLLDMSQGMLDPDWPDANNVRVAPGASFAFVSGLGGKHARTQGRCENPESDPSCSIWGKIYTQNQGAIPGALFITFNEAGDANKARGEFINVNGELIDRFDIRATGPGSVLPPSEPDPPVEDNPTPPPPPIVTPPEGAQPSPDSQIYTGRGPSIEPIFNYGDALDKAWYFYEAQRSGPLPKADYDMPFHDPATGAKLHDGYLKNRIPWRGDSFVDDGADVGLDLNGGWFDAGDHVKFGLPMAYSASALGWGVLHYEDTYRETGVLDRAKDNLRWVSDYFVRAHPEPYVLYGQVGEGQLDHQVWAPPEVQDYPRRSFKIDLENPGADLAAQTSAALTIASQVFRDEPDYSAVLLRHARELYDFADRTRTDDDKRGCYSDSIPDAASFYACSSGARDDLPFAAAWLYIATGEPEYLHKAESDYTHIAHNTGHTAWTLVWDDVRYGVYPLMAHIKTLPNYWQDTQIGLDQRVDGYFDYDAHAQFFFKHWLNSITRTPSGMAWLSSWASARYNTATAFLMLVYRDHLIEQNMYPNRQQSYLNFATEQVNYVLGDNPCLEVGIDPCGRTQQRNGFERLYGMSYIVGFGDRWSQSAHHRGSHGSTSNSPADPVLPRHILYGALAGGPRTNDTYSFNRNDFGLTEVATDMNAGINGALAGLIAAHGLEGNIPDPDFPPPAPPILEAYAEARIKHQQSETLGTQVEVTLYNNTAYPPRSLDNLRFRYFVDLSEILSREYNLSDVHVNTFHNQGRSVSNVQRWGEDGDIYFVEGSFEGIEIAPVGVGKRDKTIEFFVRLPWSDPHGNASEGWDASNDYSFQGLNGTKQKTQYITVYDMDRPEAEQLIWGIEPDGTLPTPPTPEPIPSPTPNPSPDPDPNPPVEEDPTLAPGEDSPQPDPEPTPDPETDPKPEPDPETDEPSVDPPIEAEPEPTPEPSLGDYGTTLTITSHWGKGYCARVEITPDVYISSWEIDIKMSGAPRELWSGNYTHRSGGITVTPNHWNGNVSSGSTVNFGFCASGSPDALIGAVSATTPTQPAPVSGGGSGELSADIQYKSIWGDGYCTDVTIHNSGINKTDWHELKLNLPSSQINGLWNGDNNRSSGDVSVTPKDYNKSVPAGGKVNLGFCASGSSDVTVVSVH
jgi:endoglucanase